MPSKSLTKILGQNKFNSFKWLGFCHVIFTQSHKSQAGITWLLSFPVWWSLQSNTYQKCYSLFPSTKQCFACLKHFQRDKLVFFAGERKSVVALFRPLDQKLAATGEWGAVWCFVALHLKYSRVMKQLNLARCKILQNATSNQSLCNIMNELRHI